MPLDTIADYITMQDTPKRIDGTPNALILSFKLPADFVTGTNLAKPVVQFKYRALQVTELDLYVNLTQSQATPQVHVTLEPAPHARVHHEFLDGSLFRPGETNELRFLLMGASIFDDTVNDIMLSDVMLTYQRKVRL